LFIPYYLGCVASINKIFIKEFIMTIRFIGGMWRRLDEKNIRSFTTYQGAVDNKFSWEDVPLTTADDIVAQMEGQCLKETDKRGKKISR